MCVCVFSLLQTLVQRGLLASEWVNEVASIVGDAGGGRDVNAQCSGPKVDWLINAADTARRFAELKLQ